MPPDLRIIAWDFDGVLNRNVIDGRFVWSQTIERDLGLPLRSFSQYMFKGRFQQAMIGEADLRMLIGDWLAEEGFDSSPEAIMSYWFDADARPDKRMLSILDRMSAQGIVNVMATNNEIHRTQYIEHDMGFGEKMDRIFAAGRMRMAKPDVDYYHHITDALGVSADQIMLVDDLEENTMAARELGWHAHHYRFDGYDALETALGL